MKNIIAAIIVIVIWVILSAGAIPQDRWLYWLQPGEQVIYTDDNGLTRQVTFVDALPTGYGNGCRIHESIYWLNDNEYGPPLNWGRPHSGINWFDEMNYASDLYSIYHGGYTWERATIPFLGCYANDQSLLVFSIQGYSKQVIDIRVRE